MHTFLPLHQHPQMTESPRDKDQRAQKLPTPTAFWQRRRLLPHSTAAAWPADKVENSGDRKSWKEMQHETGPKMG